MTTRPGSFLAHPSHRARIGRIYIGVTQQQCMIILVYTIMLRYLLQRVTIHSKYNMVGYMDKRVNVTH